MVIDSFPNGIPLGNLTSQLFVNIYLKDEYRQKVHGDLFVTIVSYVLLNVMRRSLMVIFQGGNMNKLELISALKNEANISKSEAARIVQIFFDSMADSMAKGDRIEIRGLCSFYVKNYKSYTGRNPKTGEKVTIKPKKLPFFKSGKELKERVDS